MPGPQPHRPPGHPVTVPNPADQVQRWPQFSPAAQTPWLRLDPRRTDATARPVLGALGLFGDRPGALNANDPGLPEALMNVASVAIVNEKSAADRDVINDQLQHALNSRIVLEQAKGVLAYVGKLDMNTAFTVLRS